MTNTIPNVPRELLERVLYLMDNYIGTTHTEEDELRALLSAPSPANHVEDVRAMVAAQSPAGVDGMGNTAKLLLPALRQYMHNDGSGLLAGYDLETTQAIIDGLRGEVADLLSMLATVSKAGIRVRTERDQHAKRIVELEAALEFACKSLAQVTSSDGSGHADIAVSVLRMAGRKEADASQIVESYKAGAKLRIDAALSAGKEKQDEHS